MLTGSKGYSPPAAWPSILPRLDRLSQQPPLDSAFADQLARASPRHPSLFHRAKAPSFRPTAASADISSAHSPPGPPKAAARSSDIDPSFRASLPPRSTSPNSSRRDPMTVVRSAASTPADPRRPPSIAHPIGTPARRPPRRRNQRSTSNAARSSTFHAEYPA